MNRPNRTLGLSRRLMGMPMFMTSIFILTAGMPLCASGQGRPTGHVVPADTTAPAYAPVVYLDGQACGRRLDVIDPDSVRLMEVRRFGPVDTVYVTSLDAPADSGRWLSPAQARALPPKKVKFSLLDADRIEKGTKILELIADEKIKSIEYDPQDKQLRVMSRDARGFPVKLHSRDSLLQRYFLVGNRLQKTMNDASPAERAAYCAARIDTLFNIEPPRFLGFPAEVFRAWVGKQLQVSPAMIQTQASGRVLVTFTIDTTGQLCNIFIRSTPGRAFSEEVIRVLNLSPRWEPALLRGAPVSHLCNMPFVFRIQPAYSPSLQKRPTR